jgi:hypothetical protein
MRGGRDKSGHRADPLEGLGAVHRLTQQEPLVDPADRIRRVEMDSRRRQTDDPAIAAQRRPP